MPSRHHLPRHLLASLGIDDVASSERGVLPSRRSFKLTNSHGAINSSQGASVVPDLPQVAHASHRYHRNITLRLQDANQ